MGFVLGLGLLLSLVGAIHLSTMTNNYMDTLRRNPDYNHHFIFFDHATFK